jgi:hypothetical protein
LVCVVIDHLYPSGTSGVIINGLPGSLKSIRTSVANIDNNNNIIAEISQYGEISISGFVGTNAISGVLVYPYISYYKGVQIASFATATDVQFGAMIDAAHQGIIDL